MKTLISLMLLGFLETAGYHLLAKYPAPGDDGWDYLTMDSPNRRLFISHGTKVDVMDADQGRVIGEIAGTRGVHGIALAPQFNRGFISCGQANEAVIFDMKTLAIVNRVPVGKKPDAIIFDPLTKRVIVNNGDSNNSTIINPADGKVTGTIDLEGAPEFAAADGKGKIFINLEDKNETVKVDPIALKVEARWSLKPCETPTALAMDTATRRLFIGGRNKMMAVLNADTGAIVATLPIGERVDAAVYEPSTHLIFFSNGDGTVDIFHQDSPDHYSTVSKLTTEAGAKTMAFDPQTHRIFLSVAQREGRTIKPGTFHVLVYGY
ncbi:MAG: YVTN family beta-propeller domain-containing protein [Acidobacteria bacterium]|nr:MAG: YVTN family beta-propeller domain-containing protein [Acidobacteriota bacterium]